MIRRAVAASAARQMSLLAKAVLGTVLLVFVLYAIDAWQKVRSREVRQMESALALMTSSVEAFLLSAQAGLLSLAQAVQRVPRNDPATIQRLLQEYASHRPEVRLAFLADMQGQLLASSHSRSVQGLPNVGDQPSFQTFLREHDASRSVYLGRPQFGRITGEWTFSLRVMLYGREGRPAGNIAVVLPTEVLVSMWRDAPKVGRLTSGVLRDDGYLLSRHPIPQDVDGGEVYGKPRTGDLYRHVAAGNFPAAGVVEGGLTLGHGQAYINLFRRLDHFPVTVFVAQPTRDIAVAWLQQLATPMVLLLVLTTAVWLAARRLIHQELGLERQRSATEAALRKSETEQRFLIDRLMAGVVIHDPHGAVLRCNAEASHILGLSFEQMVGKALIDPVWRLLQEDGLPLPVAQYPVGRVLASGASVTDLVVGVMKPGASEPSWALGRADPWFDDEGRLERIVVTFVDITEERRGREELESANAQLRQANAQLAEVAHFDTLTHLPNRVLLADRVQQAISHAVRRGKSVAVAFLDLDGFKEVNDRHGHATGDQLLVAVAQRLKSVLREGDTLARIGGDEFVAVMTDIADEHDCEPLLRRLLNVASQPVLVEGHPLQVSASIGVTIYPQDGASPEQLLRHADQAMYVAKQAGKNRFHLFDVASDAALRNRGERLRRLTQASRRSEFVLHFQPQVDMRTAEVLGMEALIRWQHPERGLLPPAEFLPVLQDEELAVVVGEQVLELALAQLEQWRQAQLRLGVSVNLFPRQLQQDDFVRKLQVLLARHPDLDPSLLELEIVETSALQDIALVSGQMQACADLGVRFALDDFGTGYSSLTYLKKLPAQLLKIDQSFVRDMLEDHDDLAIVQGVIGLSRAFNRKVIAEGVETVEHARMLVGLGCVYGQGYGIARPMPGHEVPGWLAVWQARQPWLLAAAGEGVAPGATVS